MYQIHSINLIVTDVCIPFNYTTLLYHFMLPAINTNNIWLIFNLPHYMCISSQNLQTSATSRFIGYFPILFQYLQMGTNIYVHLLLIPYATKHDLDQMSYNILVQTCSQPPLMVAYNAYGLPLGSDNLLTIKSKSHTPMTPIFHMSFGNLIHMFSL